MTNVELNNLTMTMQWANASSCWELLDAALKAGTDRILLWGPYGTGKTTAGLAANVKRYNMNFSEDKTEQDFIGHWMPTGTGGFVWHYGPGASAWREGAVLIANELGRASSAVQDSLLGILDDRRMAEMTLANGETIRPHADFKCIATTNSEPSTLEPALLDRFDVVIYMGEPNPGLVAHLNAQRDGIGTIVKDSYKDPQRAISARRILALNRLMAQGVNARQAAVMTLGVQAQDFFTACAAQGVIL